ncbi:biotin/lipoyl-containing protein [Oscillibacter sp.]|uniref:acetyl-CoA carboxylase biotin carboxyl carrier protein n=1 Tax=Oscillibacter sp. TaxID=1945593 RepID=UPI0028A8B8FF|nr:biotin/lipoyl-containing protein [Oscillibacter sp.]
MTNSEIFELMDRFEKSGILTMRVCVGGDELELSRAGSAPAAIAVSASETQEGPVIHAPLVGTFYAASAPDQPPLVHPGDRVSKGQTVCLIEAMKMMSEVTAPCDCVIEEVLVQNGDLLGFAAPIFRYREA